MSDLKYVVLTFRKYEFEINGINMQLAGTKSTGYMPIFDTEEDAKEEFPEYDVMGIRVGKKVTDVRS